MTRHFSPPAVDATAPVAILVDAARSWRQATDAGHPIQPCLARALAEHDCTMLAPVFDSLIRFYESALGRSFVTGEAMTMSDDELLLLGLLDGSRPHACLGCPKGAADTLGCALVSARIMFAMTIGRVSATVQ